MKRVLGAVLTAALLVAGCSTGKDAVVEGGTFSFVSPGGKLDITYPEAQRQNAPVLAGDDLMHEGKQLSIADFPGKVVVVNLWGQWCGPCRAEAPELETASKQMAPVGGQVVGLDVRDPAREVAQDFIRDRGITYPSIWDPTGRVLLQLQGYPRNLIPSTIVLDKKHRVAAVFLRQVLASDLMPTVQRLVTEK
ncbi:TlpA disulfide reductase family protein [Amycolatopsis sp. FDAARGOS 1241]|uniref:TlpA family protein disulfide reductase n=1 Tax=Amycolatopsis sp. FDAARGOS 1241 TaxID=2778070 RepID=UPI0019504721|nr:TlpA disulfide reductase family protein [Amycolatopsis sp. FDAARGOS 1241]QRP45501.1 TlpA family protein disulfide reductase [Amycolatopsis sp. FDAARGOS 1241]